MYQAGAGSADWRLGCGDGTGAGVAAVGSSGPSTVGTEPPGSHLAKLYRYAAARRSRDMALLAAGTISRRIPASVAGAGSTAERHPLSVRHVTKALARDRAAGQVSAAIQALAIGVL